MIADYYVSSGDFSKSGYQTEKINDSRIFLNFHIIDIPLLVCVGWWQRIRENVVYQWLQRWVWSPGGKLSLSVFLIETLEHRTWISNYEEAYTYYKNVVLRITYYLLCYNTLYTGIYNLNLTNKNKHNVYNSKIIILLFFKIISSLSEFK